jgi:hypothetical protein
MSKTRKPLVAYGGGLLNKLRPRHATVVLANEGRMLFSRLIIPWLPLRKKQFLLWNSQKEYFLHKYNTTWRNERSVELSAVKQFLSLHTNEMLLEFGNVLEHYKLGDPDIVVDLYEKGSKVTNVDIVDFHSDVKFSAIVSISTIEHVGWDEIPQSSTKTKLALNHLISTLSPDGILFITAPTGHNPFLDEMIRDGIPTMVRQTFLVRNGFEWHEQSQFVAIPYGSKGPGAASVWIAEIGPN